MSAPHHRYPWATAAFSVSDIERALSMSRFTFDRSVPVVAALLATVALAGCGSADPSTLRAAVTSSTATAPGSFGAADILFVQMMIPHHQDAVTMAELARTRSRSPRIRSVAEQISRTQQPQIDTMIGWVQAAGRPTAPPDFNTGHGVGEHAVPGTMTFTDLVRLRESSGARFDRKFLTVMIRHHRGTLVTATAEFAEVSSPEVKALGQEMAAKQKAELKTMRQILAQL
jgi:uncharacterized protein (DUF305 family)